MPERGFDSGTESRRDVNEVVSDAAGVLTQLEGMPDPGHFALLERQGVSALMNGETTIGLFGINRDCRQDVRGQKQPPDGWVVSGVTHREVNPDRLDAHGSDRHRQSCDGMELTTTFSRLNSLKRELLGGVPVVAQGIFQPDPLRRGVDHQRVRLWACRDSHMGDHQTYQQQKWPPSLFQPCRHRFSRARRPDTPPRDGTDCVSRWPIPACRPA